jgi:hypothetical protein
MVDRARSPDKGWRIRFPHYLKRFVESERSSFNGLELQAFGVGILTGLRLASGDPSRGGINPYFPIPRLLLSGSS